MENFYCNIIELIISFYFILKHMPTYIYWGEEDFSIELAVKRLRNKVLDPDWATFNHKVMDAPSIQSIIEAITTIPMGFGGVLVEVHNMNIFSRKAKSTGETDEDQPKSSVDEKDLKALLEALSDMSDRINLLFVIVFPRNSKKKIDRNLKTTKAFEAIGTIQQFDSYKSWDGSKVVPWIKEAAEELNNKIDDKAALKLFDTIGPELRKLNSEIFKLSTYVGEGKTIKISDVQTLCSGIDNVFVLADNWVHGKTHNTLVELRKLLDKDHPIKILATLQTILNEWLMIKLELKYGNKSTNLSKEMGIHPFRLNNIIKDLRSVQVERLSHLKTQLTLSENKIKTGQLSPELALEVLMTM